MMWLEAAFSSFLLLSAYFVVGAATPVHGSVSEWGRYQYANDAATLAAEAISERGKSLPACADGSADYLPHLSGRFDSLTKNTPYCLSFSSLHARIASCRGKTAQPDAASSPSSAIPAYSVQGSASFCGKSIFFKIRQWTD